MPPRVKRPHGPNGPVIVGNSVGSSLSDAMAKHKPAVASEEGKWTRLEAEALWKQRWKNVYDLWNGEHWNEHRSELSEYRWKKLRRAVRAGEAILDTDEETEDNLIRLEQLRDEILALIHPD